MRIVPAAALTVVLATVLAPAGAAGRMLTFTVKTRQGATAVHSHPPAGDIGDTYVSSLALSNGAVAQLGRAPRSTVGMMQFTFTIDGDSRADFDTVSTLPGGTVIANGASLTTAKHTITIPVVGGTGRYKGARGTVTISPSSTMLSTYRLRLR